jgi:glycosyltransferase involved in cell wall biosynthesis
VPDRIVCCAEAARRLHAGLGYDEGRMLVIGNGIDAERFRPDAEGAVRVRRELGLDAGVTLIGLVARFHPQKDHAGFLAAVDSVQRRHPEAAVLLCGEEVTPDNPALAGPISRLPAPQRVHCLGIRRDLTAVYSALDLAISSSSFGEGFSNVIIEAMACATPCVVTDVGDSAAIVGETGWTVPPRDPSALAEAICAALALDPEERRQRGLAARQRVLDEFRLEDVHAAYDRLYLEGAA